MAVCFAFWEGETRGYDYGKGGCYTETGQRGTKGSQARIARDVLEDRYLLGTLVLMYHVEDVTSSTRRQQMTINIRQW